MVSCFDEFVLCMCCVGLISYFACESETRSEGNFVSCVGVV